MIPRRFFHIAAVVLLMIVVSGCGDPKQVTYVDPNGPRPRVQGAGEASPVARFGAAAIERSKAIAQLRGALITARTLASSDPAAARTVVGAAIETQLPVVEGRAFQLDPEVAMTLRADLESLRDDPPAAMGRYGRLVRAVVSGPLARVESIVVPASAREDAGYRAVVVYELLLLAGMSFEAVTGDDPDSAAEYRTAYGVLTDVATRTADGLDPDGRAKVRDSVSRILRRAFPGPTPPDTLRDPESVSNELAAIADDVVARAGVDPTFPEVNPGTPDQLRSLKRAVAAVAESAARSSIADAQRRLDAADEILQQAADALVTVAPEVLPQLEEALLLKLPAAFEDPTQFAETAADIDALIDETITLVEEEVELLREGS